MNGAHSSPRRARKAAPHGVARKTVPSAFVSKITEAVNRLDIQHNRSALPARSRLVKKARKTRPFQTDEDEDDEFDDDSEFDDEEDEDDE